VFKSTPTFHSQVTDEDCVPATVINAIRCFAVRRSISAELIRTVWAHAPRTSGGWDTQSNTKPLISQLSKFWRKKFPLRLAVQLFEGDAVQQFAMPSMWKGDVVIAFNVYYSSAHDHYVLGLGIEDDKVLLFDPLPDDDVKAKVARGLYGKKLSALARSLGANLAVPVDTFFGTKNKPYTLGPIETRECVRFRRRPKKLATAG